MNEINKPRTTLAMPVMVYIKVSVADEVELKRLPFSSIQEAEQWCSKRSRLSTYHYEVVPNER